MLFIKSKIQFSESKSQPLFTDISVINCCLSSQRYNFLKANHNSISMYLPTGTVVYQVKDTIFWKQITTTCKWWYCDLWLFIKSKIQFSESKSQPDNLLFYRSCCCLSSQRYNFLKANHNHFRHLFFRLCVVYQVKDTIFWKQITTPGDNGEDNNVLFIKSKIQFSESKSQRSNTSSHKTFSCLSSQRYNFLKANHN